MSIVIPISRLCARSICRLGLFLALAFHTSAIAEVVFSESFESPVVSGFDDNTLPDNGNWIGSTQGFGANDRGLYNEAFAWPDAAVFTTPYGSQAYLLRGPNNGMTTAEDATGLVVTEGVEVTLSLNVAMLSSATSTDYRVELVAFDATEDNSERNDVRGGGAGTVLASANGSVTTSDFSEAVTLSYTPTGSDPLGDDLGIRLLKPGVLFDNIRVIVGHDFDPSPESGVTVPSGDVNLSWTNRPANVASDVWVDVWFGTDPLALTKVVDAAQNTTATTVNAPTADVYSWRVDTYTDGDTSGTPVTGDVFTFVVDDSEGDGIPDAWEIQHFGSATGADASADSDTDGLTNLQEFIRGTDPNNPDTDGDGLLDGVESATGIWVSAEHTGTHPLSEDTDGDGLSDGVETNKGVWLSASDTGTDPNNPDTDGDGLLDGVETNTGTYVSRFDTGTDPHNKDTDGDGVWDYYEAIAAFTDPNDPTDLPSVPYPLPEPDPANFGVSDKPVKVYIMSGQSNMVGIGHTDGIDAPGSLDNITKVMNRFPNFIDEFNNYTARQDVIYRGVVSANKNNGPLTKGQGASDSRVGPELGFGHVMGHYHDEPVLLLKASEGNRSLGWDFLPPGSTPYTIDGVTYAGYGESPQSWPEGTTPAPGQTWYAGKQYDDSFLNEADMGRLEGWEDGFDYTRIKYDRDGNFEAYLDGYVIKHNGVMYVSILEAEHIADPTNEPGVGADWATHWEVYQIENAYDVLTNFATEYPQWADQGFEIAGFVWWQGHKDGGESGSGSAEPYAQKYEDNLVNLIAAMRTEFNAPNAPFVVASIGFGGGGWSPGSSGDLIFKGQMAVGDVNQHPAFNGTVASVDITPYYRSTAESPGSQSFHYNNNAETYALVGDAMGRAMIDILETDTPPFPSPMTFEISPAAVDAATVGMVATEAEDISLPIEYYFENVTTGEFRDWSTDRRWENTGLAAGSYDFRVKARDGNGTETEWSATASASPGADATAPTPDPMSFATPPTAQGEDSITMTATTAADINGVEYYFTAASGPGNDSTWQDSPTYTDTGLAHSTEYTYTVKARDKSTGLNETSSSDPASATTDTPDLIAPTPDPMTFEVAPTAQGEDTITMTASAATDDSGVEYYFEETSGNPGGTDSGWQDGTEHTDTGLDADTEYTYVVRARDKSPAQNTTADSTPASATTDAPDLTAPSISTTNPADDASDVAIDSDLIVTFDEDISAGTGLITLKNLTDTTETTINVGDGSQVSISGSVLTINPGSSLLNSQDYAVHIAATAITDLVGNAFAGIADDTTWNFTSAAPPPDGVVFSDDFEPGENTWGGTTPDVDAADSDGFTSGKANTTLWVRATEGFGAGRNGLVDESGGDFTDPVGEQAHAFRYTNSGLTTAEGIIGSLTSGVTYTVTFDGVIDGHNGGSDYNVSLVTFDGGARDDVRDNAGATSKLASVSGTISASYEKVTLGYTADGTEGTLGHDVAIRVNGSTGHCIIDNVQVVTESGDDSTAPTVSSLNPLDDATDVAVDTDLIVTFNEDIAVGSGNIVLKNLTDASESSIDVTDGTQVSISGTQLTLNPTGDLLNGKDYAVQIAATAIEDLAGNAFAGISDDTSWNFTTVAAVTNDFSSWISGYDVGALTGPDDDADGDGVSNAAENYFGTDPSSSSTGLSAKAVAVNGDTTFTFSHPINDTPAADITAAYQWSTDLTAFHAAGATANGTTVSFAVGTPADGEVEVTATITGTEPDKVFVTVDVTQNP